MNKNLFVKFVFCIPFSFYAQFPLLQKWDSLFKTNQVEIIRLSLNSKNDDFSPVFVNKRFFFTSTRYNQKTPEISLKWNQRVYVADSDQGKTDFNYYFNFDENVAVAGINENNPTLYLYMPFGNGDLYVSEEKEKGLTRPKKLPFPINHPGSSEQSITWVDGSYYFSTNRENEQYDIYKATQKNKKEWYVEPLSQVNSYADEVDVRIFNNILFFSSNRQGKFKPYYYANETVGLVDFLPDSFKAYDVRDFLLLDSVFYFSSNLHGNFDIYKGKLKPLQPQLISEKKDEEKKDEEKKDTSLVILDNEQKNTIDTVKISSLTTSSVKPKDKLTLLHEKLDSLGLKPPYVCYVQVGAYYGLNNIEDFKRIFVAFDTSQIFIEKVETPQGTLHKFLLLPSYSKLADAIQRQQIALKQQSSPRNRKKTQSDAFVALYDANHQRIAIFVNYTKEEFIILMNGKKIRF
ncbi:MAG: hypothetical protein N2Z72_02985 [Bacteroidales bacterium]|nr:hypothetical protein [Bacteroidales bacterium]